MCSLGAPVSLREARPHRSRQSPSRQRFQVIAAVPLIYHHALLTETYTPSVPFD